MCTILLGDNQAAVAGSLELEFYAGCWEFAWFVQALLGIHGFWGLQLFLYIHHVVHVMYFAQSLRRIPELMYV